MLFIILDQYSVPAPRYDKLIVRPTLLCLWLRPCRCPLRPFTMNALQDLSKKTSINSLLNPQGTSAFPASVGANPGHHDNQGVIYATSFSNGSSFQLRAASWDSVNEAERKAENGANGHRHLHHQHTSSTDRASVGLAARGMVTEASQHHQDTHNGMPHCPPNSMYHPAVYSHHQQQSEVAPLASLPAQPRPVNSSGSAKRPSPDSEVTPAPKAKRTAKPKTGPEGNLGFSLP